MRFRKRIEIFKGVKLNLSKSGMSATVGGKGISLNLGKQGVFLNTSIPGTGLYDRKKLIGPFGEKKEKKKMARQGNTREQEIALPNFALEMEQDGDVTVINEDSGKEITSSATLRKIRATDEYKDEYAELMEDFKEQIEAETDNFVEIFRYAEALRDDWEEDDKYLSPAYVEGCLDGWLENLQLPVEFKLEYEFISEEQRVMVDLDLPEIEDIPELKAVELADGSVKARNKSLKETREDYCRCVFGLGVYFASNIFNVSPYIEQVCVSGYSQRRDKMGDLADEYIYSVKFTREGMENVDFTKIDPVDFCMQFENRCRIMTSGEMKEIEPYA